MAELVQLNGLSDANVIRVGQKLVLPSNASPASRQEEAQGVEASDRWVASRRVATEEVLARTYTVKAGDSLGGIAHAELGSVKRMGELIQLNGLENADKIYEGQRLKLPPAGTPSSDLAVAAAGRSYR